ncbi:DUF4148 domain-containing protein [Caballeronia humi]|nr:DUF4148 domain-containing protein [Caballeronia humi]
MKACIEEAMMDESSAIPAARITCVLLAALWIPCAAQSQQEDRDARRARRDAELTELRANGYQSTLEDRDYPQNIQDAQRKIEQKKALAAPAGSAP